MYYLVTSLYALSVLHYSLTFPALYCKWKILSIAQKQFLNEKELMCLKDAWLLSLSICGGQTKQLKRIILVCFSLVRVSYCISVGHANRIAYIRIASL